MIAVTPALHLLIVLSMAQPTVDPSPCAANDLHCSARAFTASARRAKSDAERVEYLYFAHRAYLALSEESPKGPVSSRELCQAKQLIEQAAALPTTELRERVIKSRKATRTRLKREHVRCKQPKQQAKNDLPLVALTDPQAEPGEPAKLLTRTLAPETLPATPTSSELVAAPRAIVAPAPEAEAPDQTRDALSAMPIPPTPTASELRSRETWTSPIHGTVPSGPPPGRRLLITGGISLVAGLGLTGIAAYNGAHAVAARRTGFTAAELAASPDNMVRDAALRADYEHRGTVAVATGITGGAALVAAIVMLCVGARRKARAADSEPILMPIRTGLLFTGKF